MDLHVKILATCHLVLGVLGLLGSFLLLVAFGGTAGIIGMAANTDPDAWIAVPIVGLVGGLVVMLVFILSVPGIIAGIGLLKLRPWARILAIVLSVIGLLNIPFGTCLGIYGLWVLFSPKTIQLFGATPVAAPSTAPPPPTA